MMALFLFYSYQRGEAQDLNKKILEIVNNARIPNAEYIYDYNSFENISDNTIIRDIYFSRDETSQGIAVLDSNVVIITDDGGETWSNILLNNNVPLQKILLFKEEKSIVLAKNGGVYLSEDWGKTWVPHTVLASSNLNSGYFFNTSIGWVVGDQGEVFKTNDGGETWTRQVTSIPEKLHDVYFSTATTGWIIGDNGTIAKTQDGGVSWEKVYARDRKESLRAITFFNDYEGILVGEDGLILKTNNAGNWWEVVKSNTDQLLVDVEFFDGRGWIVGNRGAIISTNDNGVRWELADTLLSGRYFSTFPLDNNSLLITSNESGVIKYTYELMPSMTLVEPTYAEIGSRVKIEGSNFGSSKHARIANLWLGNLLVKPSSWSDTAIYFSIPKLAEEEEIYSIRVAIGKREAVLLAALKIQTGSFLRKSFWKQRQIFTEGENLTDIFYLDNQHGWITSDRGLVYRTVNGGESWIGYPGSSPETTLTGVFFLSKRIGFVISASGDVLRSEDSGKSFRQVYSEENRGLSHVFFIDYTHGWIVGERGTILKTVDGGNTWERVLPIVSDDLLSVQFTSKFTGIVVGEKGIILKTDDGGDTWVRQSSIVSETLADLFFVNEDVVWIVGRKGVLLKSLNGGDSWSQMDIGVLKGVRTIKFVNSKKGWIFGQHGFILKTTDAGKTWKQEFSPLRESINAAIFMSERVGWLVGSNSMLMSRDINSPLLSQILPKRVVLGETLSLRGENFGPSQEKGAVVLGPVALKILSWSDTLITALAPSLESGRYPLKIIVGEEIILGSERVYVGKRSEAGQDKMDTDLSVTSQVSGQTSKLFKTIFHSQRDGWAVGDSGTLLRTNDGGESWERLSIGTRQALRSIYTKTGENIWAVGQKGTIIHSMDGGNSWYNQVSRTENLLTSIFFLNDELGWAVGQNGTVLFTATRGDIWAPIEVDSTNEMFTNVQFLDEKVGWISGLDGSIYKTDNGGRLWRKVYQASDDSKLLGMFFVTPQVGYFSGSNGLILATFDSGNTWVRQATTTQSQLVSIFFFDENHGWAIGDDGIVLKTSSRGKVWHVLDINERKDLTSVYFINENLGWIVGEEGSIYRYMEAPAVFHMSLNKGKPNQQLEIVGSFLGSHDSGYKLKFGEKEASILSWTPEKIVALVPNLSAGLYVLSIDYRGKTFPVNASFMISAPSVSAKGWKVVRQGRKDKLIESVFFINSKIGWAVGVEGQILKTTNGGKMWTVQKAPDGINFVLTSVFFKDDKMGWIVGSYGTILKTVNGGDLWRKIDVQTYETLIDVEFKGDFGCTVSKDGSIYVSNDQGEHWKAYKGLFSELKSVFLYNKKVGWAVGSKGSVYHTENTNELWGDQSTETFTHLTDVFFINRDTGWVTGNSGEIIRTLNGGKIWLSTEPKTNQNLNSIYFVNERIGWAVGAYGTALKTTNGGANWSLLTIPTKRNLIYVFFEDPLTGLVVTDRGEVFSTVDGGATWMYTTKETFADLNSVFFINGSVGWVVGDDGVILKTTNSGFQWESTFIGKNLSLESVFFSNEKLGWICGYEDGGRGVLFKTIDGGENWVRKKIPVFAKFYNVIFENDNLGWILGSGGVVMKTENAGESWKSIESNSIRDLYRATWIDRERLLAVGNDYTITSLEGYYRSENQIVREDLAIPTHTDIYFENHSTGWIVGYYRNSTFIRKTLDSAKTWTTTTFNIPQKLEENILPLDAQPSMAALRAISFSSNNIGWVVGDHGNILKTSNAGNSWEIVSSKTTNDLNDVFFIGKSLGWVVGSDGIILKYSEDEIPEVFSIYPTSFKEGDRVYIQGVELDKGGKVFFGDYASEVISWTSREIIVQAPMVLNSAFYKVHIVLLNQDTVTFKKPVFIERGRKQVDEESPWILQPSPFRGSYHKIHFSSIQQGVAVGSNGVRIATSNSLEWKRDNSIQIDGTLRSVFFSSRKKVWAVGDNGLLIKSEDGGFSWRKIFLPSQASFNDIFFPDLESGWIIEEKEFVYQTVNSGESWSKVFVGNTAQQNAISFVDTKFGWIVGNRGSIASTQDGGLTWQVGKLPTNEDLVGISSAAGTAWVVSRDGSVFKLERNSTGSFIGRIDEENATSVAFSDSFTGWISTEGGSIFSTTDGGLTWKKDIMPLESINPIRSVFFLDIQNGWAVGDGGTILKYKARKASHRITKFTPSVATEIDTTLLISGVGFGDILKKENIVKMGDVELHVLSWSDNAIRVSLPRLDPGSYPVSVRKENRLAASEFPFFVQMKSKDKDAVWINQKKNILDRKGKGTFSTMVFLNRDIGWSAGSKGQVFKTNNGGLTWQNASLPYNLWIYGMDFTNHVRGWVVGQEGAVYRTVDGGQNWKKQYSPSRATLNAVSFYDAVHGFAAGALGTILVTHDAGVHWDLYKYYDDVHFYDILRINKRVGFASSSNGVLIKTNDGGKQWEPVDLGTKEDIVSISFSEDKTLIAYQRNGVLHKSNDTGRTWQRIVIPGAENVTDGVFLDSQVGWVVTSTLFENARVFNTIDGGLSWQVINLDDIVSSISLGNYRTLYATGGSIWKYKETPEIESISPLQVDIGDEIVIRGKNFGERPLQVYLGPMKTSYTFWSDTLIISKIPKIPSGSYSFRLDLNNERISSIQTFYVKGNTASENDFWTDASIQKNETFVRIDQPKRDYLVALGRTGRVFATTNNGKSWYNVKTKVDYSTSIDFIEDSLSCVVGSRGRIAYSFDRWRTWVDTLLESSVFLADIFLLDVSTGWAVGGNGAVYRFQNGIDIQNWVRVSSPIIGKVSLSSVFFINKKIGWVAGQAGQIFKTEDAGITWKRLDSQTSFWLSDIYFIDRNVGWAVGERGTFLSTVDGGNTWTLDRIDEDTWLQGIKLDKKGMGAIVGETISEEGVVFISQGGGAFLKKEVFNGTQGFYGLGFLDPSTIWVSGTNGTIIKRSKLPRIISVRKSQDRILVEGEHLGQNGKIWIGEESASVDKWTPTSIVAYLVELPPGRYPVVVEADLGTVSADTLITFTTNKTLFSESWVEVSIGTEENIQDVSFWGDKKAWAITARGHVYLTEDGALTWNPIAWIDQELKDESWFTSISFSTNEIGWVSGNEGRLFKTVDGGKTWKFQESTTWDWINSVYSFSGAQVAFAVGAKGLVLKTVDGGSTWVKKKVSSNAHFSKVFFLDYDQNVGWIVGQEGEIWKTQDGGNVWKRCYTNRKEWITSVSFADKHNGWAVGENGLLLRTNNGGESWISQGGFDEIWFEEVVVLKENIGWLVSSSPIEEGIIFGNSYGVSNWQIQVFEEDKEINSIAFPLSRHGISVASGGSIYKYTTVPVVTKFFPPKGSYGEEIHIEGRGFGFSQGRGFVKLGNFLISTKKWTDTLIIAAIPPIPRGSYFISVQNQDGLSGTSKDPFIVQVGRIALTWYEQISNTSEDLRGVSFSTPYFGITVGRQGTILRTVNGGSLWESVFNPNPANLYGVCMINEKKGWIVGEKGTILKTTNGGLLWEPKRSWTSYNLNAVTFFDELHGWAVGDVGTILFTTDGGENWYLASSKTLAELYDVTFISHTEGWAVGKSGTILHTRDGGHTWGLQRVERKVDFYSVSFVKNGMGWIAGNEGVLLNTKNAGINWNEKPLDVEVPLQRVHFENNLLGWITSGNAYTGSVILKTFDGGNTWILDMQDSLHLILDLDFSTKYSGWAIGTSGVIKKFDSGNHTHQVFALFPTYATEGDIINIKGVGFGSDRSFGKVLFDSVQSTIVSWNDTLVQVSVPKTRLGKYNLQVIIDSDTVTAPSEFQILPTYKAQEGIWTELSKSNAPTIFDVFFRNENEGWMVGARGHLLKTVDGGSSWKIINATQEWLYTVFFVTSDIGWIAGERNTILKTEDGGETWKRQMHDTTGMISNMYFLDKQRGWAVGSNGLILKTRNGGKSWTKEIVENVNDHLQQVLFVDNKTGWIVGWNGTLVRTKNGGKSWSLQRDRLPIQDLTLTSISFSSRTEGWIVGTNGLVIATRNGGTNWFIQGLDNVQERVKNIWIRKVQFLSFDQGWAVSGDVISNGNIFRSSVSGEKWDKVEVSVPLYGLYFFNKKQRVAVGADQTLITYQKSDVVEVLDMWPSEGLAGSSAIIKGENFGVKQGISQVLFEESPAQIQSWTDTLIEVTVPPSIKGPNQVTVIVDGSAAISPRKFFIEKLDYKITGLKWIKQKVPTSKPLKSLIFIDDKNGIVVGSKGTILKTIDGGESWRLIRTNVTNDLLSVFFLAGGEKGWAVGTNGTILTTLDMGNTWERILPHTSYIDTEKSFTDIFFFNKESGFLTTSDGALTYYDNGRWEIIPSIDQNSSLSKIAFLDDSYALAVGENGRAFKIMNVVNWSLLNTKVEAALRDIFVYDQDNAWIVGGDSFDKSIILRTKDAGSTWVRQTSPTDSPITGIFFVTEKIGWAVGFRGNVIQTTDGGDTWIPIETGIFQNIQDVFFVNKNTGWLVGDNGAIYKYTSEIVKDVAVVAHSLLPTISLVGGYLTIKGVNFGVDKGRVSIGDVSAEVYTWDNSTIVVIVPNIEAGVYPVRIWTSKNQSTLPPSALSVLPTIANVSTIPKENKDLIQSVFFSSESQFQDVVFLDDQIGWTIGSRGWILKTMDGGYSWKKQAIASRALLKSIYFYDEKNGWIVGSQGTLLRTADGGKSWEKISLNTSISLNTIVFDGENREVGWIGADKGVLFKTFDGGMSWNKKELGITKKSLHKIHFTSSQHGILVGEKGLILKTRDGGDNWAFIINNGGVIDDIHDLHFFGKRVAIAVGDAGTLIYSTDAGSSWRQIEQTNRGLNYRKFFAHSNDEWWVVGDAILKTSDKGKTWSQLTSAFLDQFRSIYFTTNRLAIVVDNGGSIWRLSDILPTWEKFSLLTSSNLNHILFTTDMQGYVAGSSGEVFKTEDGGVSWARTKLDSKALRKIFFLNEKDGWVVGDSGTIYKTENGGEYWEEKSISESLDFYEVIFISKNVGWVVANNQLIQTRDGGETWSLQVEFNEPIAGINFFDENKGVSITQKGATIQTTDGGRSWQNIKWDVSGIGRLAAQRRRNYIALVRSILGKDINDVVFPNKENGWAITGDGDVLRTRDGVENWDREYKASSFSLRKLVFTKKDVGFELWIIGKSSQILVLEKGVRWQEKNFFEGYNFSEIKDVFFEKNKKSINVWVCGINSSGGSVVLRSENLGKEWKEKYRSNKEVDRIFLNDNEDIQVIFSDLTGVISKDHGKLWEEVPQTISVKPSFMPEEPLYASFFTSLKKGVSVGNYGVGYFTVDSGKTWVKSNTQTYNRLNDVYFENSQVGWAVGGFFKDKRKKNRPQEWGAIVLKTVDGGKNWQYSFVEKKGSFNSVFFSKGKGWVVGDSGLAMVYKPKKKKSATNVPNQTVFVVKGSNFGNRTEASRITYNGEPLFISFWSNNEIHAVYPKSAELDHGLEISANNQKNQVNRVPISRTQKISLDVGGSP